MRDKREYPQHRNKITKKGGKTGLVVSASHLGREKTRKTRREKRRRLQNHTYVSYQPYHVYMRASVGVRQVSA